LFYLRARGLDMAAARRVLTTAFAATIVEQIADANLRERVLEQVITRLSSLTEP
jgi:Fe-S cluster assembly scaffold protein SufB